MNVTLMYNCTVSQLRNTIVKHKHRKPTVLSSMLRSSFMKRLSGASAVNTKIGHEVEKTIIKNLVLLSNNKAHLFEGKKIVSVFKVGLMESHRLRGLRCSPDSFGVMQDESGNNTPICIEAKCRTRLSTMFAEIEYSIDPNCDDSIVAIVDAGTDKMMANIHRDNELMQIYHQAATLEVRCVILTIGNKKGEIIKVVVVNFTSQQTLAFRNCARDVLRRGTDFIFEAHQEKKDILEIVTEENKKQILLAIERVEELTWDTFVHAARFFIAFMDLDLPVRPSKKVLPYLCTLWNRLKNGSDTATQLIRSSWFPLPHPSRSPMGYVCQRLIFLSIFQVMRLQSVFDVQPLDTLDGWRKRFNKNQGSFKEGIYSLSTDVIIPMIETTSDK